MGRYAEEASVTLNELEILDVVDQIAVVHLKCTSARPARALSTCAGRGLTNRPDAPAVVPRKSPAVVYIDSFTIKIGGVTQPTLFDVLIEDPQNGNALGRVGTLEMPSLVEEDLRYGTAVVGIAVVYACC